jgi:hypothetical protein
MKSQPFVDGKIKELVSYMKIRIFNSFMVKVSGRKGREFLFICLGHGMKAGSHCSSRALEMIGLQPH